MNAKQAECDDMRTPRSATRAAAGAAGDVPPIKHQSHVVGTFCAAVITRCGQDSSIPMGHRLWRQNGSTKMKAYAQQTHTHTRARARAGVIQVSVVQLHHTSLQIPRLNVTLDCCIYQDIHCKVQLLAPAAHHYYSVQVDSALDCKVVSAFGQSNNSKWQWWVWTVAAYMQTHSPSWLVWSEHWQPFGISVCTQ